MFIPFLAAAAVATTFVHLGAMSVQSSVLKGGDLVLGGQCSECRGDVVMW